MCLIYLCSEPQLVNGNPLKSRFESLDQTNFIDFTKHTVNNSSLKSSLYKVFQTVVTAQRDHVTSSK